MRVIVIIFIRIVVMVMQDVIGMLGNVLDDELHVMAFTATQYMRDVTLRGSNSLPWKYHHQENQECLFHIG